MNLIAEAAEQGEKQVFAEAHQWEGSGERFESIRQCVARLQSLSRPFLNWAGKAERQQISVPTVPLFVHERHSTRAILEKLKSYKAAGHNLELFGDPQADIADKLETESVEAENLPCWMLDTDYNGLVFCASQVFFPRTGAWDNLKKSLRAEFDDSMWAHLAGTKSEPFPLGEHRRVAVKVIDERGNELMVVREPD